MKTLTTLEQRVERIERKLKDLERHSHWAGVATVKKLTGWSTKERLRRARENGEVLMKRKNGKILYDLNSIHPSILKTA